LGSTEHLHASDRSSIVVARYLLVSKVTEMLMPAQNTSSFGQTMKTLAVEGCRVFSQASF
jgi:hypothetical protein